MSVKSTCCRRKGREVGGSRRRALSLRRSVRHRVGRGRGPRGEGNVGGGWCHVDVGQVGGRGPPGEGSVGRVGVGRVRPSLWRRSLRCSLGPTLRRRNRRGWRVVGRRLAQARLAQARLGVQGLHRGLTGADRVGAATLQRGHAVVHAC